MFCNNDELISLASSDLQAVEVIDPSFICFTSLWGIALPGAGSCTRRWAILVTFLVLACGALCFSRFFPPNGAQLVRLLDLAAECGGASHGLHPTSGASTHPAF